jgi:hypothetical protein
LTLAGTFSTSMPEPDTGVVGYNTGPEAVVAAVRGAMAGLGLMVLGAVRARPGLGFGGAVRETTMGGKT